MIQLQNLYLRANSVLLGNFVEIMEYPLGETKKGD